jgi:hypothetical protein
MATILSAETLDNTQHSTRLNVFLSTFLLCDGWSQANCLCFVAEQDVWFWQMVGDWCEVRNSSVIVTTLSWVNGLSDRHETLLPVPRNLATLHGEREYCETYDGADIASLQMETKAW